MIKRYSVFFPFRWHKHAVSALRGLLFSAVSVAHLLSEGGGLNTGRKSEALASRVSLPPGGERGERGGGGGGGRGSLACYTLLRESVTLYNSKQEQERRSNSNLCQR